MAAPHLRIGILVLAFLLALASTAMTAPLQVSVSIPPQKWLSDRIGGEGVITTVLVARGQDPHTFEPTPRQIAAISRSKIYFTIGMEFEQQITQKLDAAVAGLTMIDTTASISRRAIGEHGRKSETDHGGHHNDGPDPHVWLSPPNLIKMAEIMATAMSTADPDHAADYRKNLHQTVATLEQLHHELSLELAPFKGASFYVFHPSFGYFAREYGLRQEAVEISGKSPTPKQLSALIAKAREDRGRIIFAQPQFDSRSAAAVARAIDGVVEPLDPLAEDVAANLRTMAARITKALSHDHQTRP
jgi:zinc transport system substrate-binding protein